MDITALELKMVVLFFSIMVGYIAAKVGVLTLEGNKTLSKLLVNVTSPLLILSSVFKGEHALTNAEVFFLTVQILCCYACTIPLSFLIPKLLRVPRKDANLYRFMFVFSNIGFIGYPVVSSLFGAGAIFYVSLFVLFFQVFCYSYGVSLVSGAPKFRFRWSVFKQPCLIAALFSYVFYISGLKVPTIVYDATAYVGNLTSPLAMLVIGCSLAQMELRKVVSNWRIYILCVLKMIVLPLIMYSVLHLVITNELMLGVTMVVLCMPVATNTTLVCYEYGSDASLASTGIFISTVLSLFTIPLIMKLLFA